MTKFSDLKLDPKVLKAVAEAGYENPTPIQAGAIPPALDGRDVLGIAQTGTGKTASFTLPMITLLGRGRARARMPRSLVLCPTRELAAQVAENFETYAKHTRLTKALLIGGVSFGEQDKLIDRGVDVLIATPGRLLDHFERGKLLLTGVQIMVVDEADRMLDMGFIPDIERIFQLTPFTRQTLFFSATMAPEIERITDTFLHSPERIEVARQATTSETITQKLVQITPTRRDQSAKQKRELLRAIIRAEGDNLKNAIIFCNRKTEVDIVAKSLKAHGFDAAPIHGDLDQRHRTATLDEFREGKLRLLIASDVAARGLDIPAVSHVFNFDLPSHAEDYVHRIGRTGRAGRTGTAFSISTPADDKLLAAIEALVKQSLPRVELPEGFALTDASQEAPRPRENGNRRERGRDRDHRDSRRHDADPRPHSHTEAKVAARPEQVERAERPAREEQRSRGERPRDERPRDESQPEDRVRDDRPRDERRERHNDRRERGDRNDRGERHSIMGLGEHMPEFMTRSFRPRIIEHEADETVEIAAPAAEAQPEAKPQSKSGRSRNRSQRRTQPEAAVESAPVADVSVAEVMAADVTGAEAAPNESAAQPDVAAQPDLADLPAVQAPVAETTPAVDAAAAAPAEPAKPARKPRAPRKSQKTLEAEAAAPEQGRVEPAATTDVVEAPAAMTEPGVDVPAKPKRKAPVRKAAAPAAGASETLPKVAKPRAPRKPRVKAADTDDTTGAAVESAPGTGADDKAQA